MFGHFIDCPVVGDQPLYLLPVCQADIPALTGWLNNPAVTRHINAPFARTPEMEMEWYYATSIDPNVFRWSVWLGDRHVGQLEINAIDWIARTGEVTVLIGPKEMWGKGIATRILIAQADFAFRSLNLTCLYLASCEANLGCVKAAKKAGYAEWGRQPYGRFAQGSHFKTWHAYIDRRTYEKSGNHLVDLASNLLEKVKKA